MISTIQINATNAPRGVCPAKLARRLKIALSLARKPKLIYFGRVQQGTDNLLSGTIEVHLPGDATIAQEAVDAIISQVNPCDDTTSTSKADAGHDVDDLDDLLPLSFPGQTLFVRDLDKSNGQGKGCMVYRDQNSWRRVADDLQVYP